MLCLTGDGSNWVASREVYKEIKQTGFGDGFAVEVKVMGGSRVTQCFGLMQLEAWWHTENEGHM